MNLSSLSLFRRKPDYVSLLRHCVFVDTETAGLDPSLNGLLSVGAVSADGRHEHYGECHVYSFQRVEKAALKVNGFTMEQCRDTEKDSAHECVRKLVEWARGILPPNPAPADRNPPIGYLSGKNPAFDLSMLASPWNAVFAKDGPKPEPFPFSHRVMDLTSIATFCYLKEGRTIPPGGISSGELQAYLGMDTEPSPHNALTGARYARNQMLALLSKL